MAMGAKPDIESFESVRSIEPVSQRDLMIGLASFFWLLISLQAVVAGAFEEGAQSDLQIAGRFLIGSGALAISISGLTWVRRLGAVRLYRLVCFGVFLATTIQVVLSTYGSGAVAAMYVSFAAVAMFVGQFLRLREVILSLLLVTVYAGVGAVLYYGEPNTPHVLSRAVAIVPVLWVASLSVYAVREDKLRALADAERIAFSDPLTGLLNLRSLRRHAVGLLELRGRPYMPTAGVLVIDLDGFRSANVLHGHVDGDRLLVSIAAALSAAAKTGHSVARTGSDEFMVLIEHTSEADVQQFAAAYRQIVLDTIDADPIQSVGIDASVGWAISARDGATFDELVRAADRGMYSQKELHERNPELRARQDAAFERAAREPHAVLTDAGRKPEPTLMERLRWSERPLQPRFLAICWFVGSVTVAVSLAMPDAEVANMTAVAITLAVAFLMAPVRYITAPIHEDLQQLIDIFAGSTVIALVTYWTGGASSPAWPMLMLVVIYAGWFLPLRWILPVCLWTLFVAVLPIVYEGPLSMPAIEGAALYGGICVGAALAMLVYYNHFYLVRARETTRRLAAIDPRTGIHNRRELERRLQEEIDSLSYGDSDALAVVMIDLGDFKRVSANHGRSVADRLLTVAARALDDASRAEDCVARLGGDEFAVVLPGVDADTARNLALRLLRAVGERLDQSSLPDFREVAPSAGFSLYGMHGRTRDELVTAADVALTAAKTASRGDERVSSFVVSL